MATMNDGRQAAVPSGRSPSGRATTEACRRMTSRPFSSVTPFCRALACLATLALLAACSSGQGQNPVREAQDYVAHARRSYAPPGPPGDPWGPYIVEAAHKYDVPERWVREVMHQESGGQEYENGQLIMSPVGAMGLMQVMPETYDELRARYGLGSDPYDPHDNILAGVAYMREMYDAYGYPGFLAAYNAGPGRLDDYLMHNKPLPDETRRYVARVGRAIAGTQPMLVSAADQSPLNRLPLDIPPGPRYPRTRGAVRVALASNRAAHPGYTRLAVQSTSLPEPPHPVAPPTLVAANTQQHRGFRLISQAVAETMPLARNGAVAGSWAIQVGAFGNESLARAATESARTQLQLHSARPEIGTVHQAHGVLYRARLVGLSHESAAHACQKLAHGHNACIVLSPESQS